MKNEEDQILRKHFTDLAQKADQSHIATFTGFLSLPEQSVFYSMDFSYVPHCVFGGQEGCERAVIRFGEEWEFPICCIKMAPLMNKFADALTHRDFLGALMNLGIERSTLGDIYIEDKTGYLFCLKILHGSGIQVCSVRSAKSRRSFCRRNRRKSSSRSAPHGPMR